MNIKLKIFLLALVCILATTDIMAQLRGHCGVTYEMEQQLPQVSKKDVLLYKEAHPERFASINIPVTFHLTATSAGEERINKRSILNSLQRMNKDYAPHGIVFYLKDGGFNDINNTNIFSNPGTNGPIIEQNKDGAAVDIFITENADTGSDLGTTLGYYSPAGDYIIIRKKEMSDSSATMSHEVGHYFSLRHPHSGWDEPYDKDLYGATVPFTKVPGTGATIELMDGSNCESAGDGLCDTPPDYLLGFTTQICIGTFGVFDPNGDALVSQANLSMGYFNNCPKYVFSPEQIDRLKMNIASTDRDFLNSTYIPNETVITGDLTITSPENQEKVEHYDGVELSWEGVENADNYLVEIHEFADQSVFYEYITSNTSLYVTDLSPNTTYNMIVKPFNDANTAYPQVNRPFLTGNSSTAVVDPTFVSDFVVYPNPSTIHQNILIDLTSQWSGTADIIITDLAGKTMQSQTINISTGHQQITAVQNGNIESGVYLLQMKTAKGTVVRKIVIQ